MKAQPKILPQIVHDLATPLNVALLSVEELLEKESGSGSLPASQKEYLKMARVSLRQANRQVKKLRRYF